MKKTLKSRWGDVDRSLAVAERTPTVILVVGVVAVDVVTAANVVVMVSDGSGRGGIYDRPP